MRRYEWSVRTAALLRGVECRTRSEGIHLTFDDGPDPRSTPGLLEALARHGARATFFLLSHRAAADPGLLRATVDAGHSIASHGRGHVDAWRVKAAEAIADLSEGTDALEQALGRPIRRVRPPFGRLRPATLHWAIGTGRTICLWSRMPGDFRPDATPETVARRVAERVRPGDIVVLHDARSGAAETAARTAERLADRWPLLPLVEVP